MDDLDACRELCERHGLPGPAAALRDVVEGRLPIFVVRSGIGRGTIEFHGLDPADFAEGWGIFRDRAEADRAVRARSARALRGQRSGEYANLSRLSDADYCRRVGAILGGAYRLPPPGEPAFPAAATDEQLARIADLIDDPLFGVLDGPLFEVVAIGPGDEDRAEDAWSTVYGEVGINGGEPDDAMTRAVRAARAIREARRPAADELLAGSDLCEEHALFGHAAMLRALAGAGGRAYIVAQRDVDYNDEHWLVARDDGRPRGLFFDRAEAEAEADLRNADWLRGLHVGEFGNELADFSSLPTETELNRRVAEALGAAFDLRSTRPAASPFPADATDAQMIEVSRAFDRLRPFRVIEAEFGG